VGVSACLLGQRVRYDSDSRPHAWICNELPRHAGVLPFCPETQAGLATPRPPVQLVQLAQGGIRALGVENPDLDVTEKLQQWTEQQLTHLRALDAMIFKSRSPSCGLGSVPLHDADGAVLQSDFDGIYAAWVRQHFPDLQLCDEVWLEEKRHQEMFLRRLEKKVWSRCNN